MLFDWPGGWRFASVFPLPDMGGAVKADQPDAHSGACLRPCPSGSPDPQPQQHPGDVVIQPACVRRILDLCPEGVNSDMRETMLGFSITGVRICGGKVEHLGFANPVERTSKGAGNQSVLPASFASWREMRLRTA